MYFELLSEITDIAIIAKGVSVRDRALLNERYGVGNWRKLKGYAYILTHEGETRYVELHWYEAHGIGKRRMKIKRFLD